MADKKLFLTSADQSPFLGEFTDIDSSLKDFDLKYKYICVKHLY